MMRNILGQTKSGFNIREIMDNKKILLVNLSKGKTGELNAKLLGMIFVMKFQAAAMSRQDIPEDERQDFCLFVDEFQNFATESFESILSEARKYRLNLVLANQFMTQLTDKIREALLGNVGTIMSGRLGVTDAELMEKAFSPVFTAEDLHKQPNFCAIATVMMFDMPTSPFTISLLPPMGDSSDELMTRMKAYALSKYGRPRAEVEAEIDERLAATDEKSKAKLATETTTTAGATGAATAMGVTGAANDQKPVAKPKKNFLDSWLEKKAQLGKKSREDASKAMEDNLTMKGGAKKSATPDIEAPKPIKKVATPPVREPAVLNETRPTTTQAPAPTPVQISEPTVAERPSPATAPTPQQVVQPAAKSVLQPAPNPTALNIQHDSSAHKLDAAEELIEMSTGSTWTATAAENAANTTVNETKKATNDFLKADAKLKIQHEPRKVLNVSQQAVAPTTSTPVTQTTATPNQANQSVANAVKDDEDGIVLRWR